MSDKSVTRKFFNDIDSGFFNNSQLLDEFEKRSNGNNLFRLEILITDLRDFIQSKLNKVILSYKPLMTDEQNDKMIEELTEFELHPMLLNILIEDKKLSPEDRKQQHFKTETYNLKVAEALLESLILQEKEKVPKEKPSKVNSILINGRAPNIEERYYIACKIFNIDKIINSKNITQSNKDDLLALALGVGKQTARELNNGSYAKRTNSLKTDILDDYIRSISK